jgi:hypothetical protein
MKKALEEMGLKKFRQVSTFLFILADVWILSYIYKKFTSKETMDRLIEIAAKQQQIDKVHMEQLYQLLTQSLILMLALVLVVHLITYILYIKNKKFTFAYLNLYAWTAMIGCPLWGLSVLADNIFSGFVFIMLGGILVINVLGLRMYPFQENSPK